MATNKELEARIAALEETLASTQASFDAAVVGFNDEVRDLSSKLVTNAQVVPVMQVAEPGERDVKPVKTASGSEDALDDLTKGNKDAARKASERMTEARDQADQLKDAEEALDSQTKVNTSEQEVTKTEPVDQDAALKSAEVALNSQTGTKTPGVKKEEQTDKDPRVESVVVENIYGLGENAKPDPLHVDESKEEKKKIN